ncbi:MAG: hypothetical protein HGA47_12720 [Zoogloea sp.]|nr:hypothetical protein [Zoogloea sp.]
MMIKRTLFLVLLCLSACATPSSRRDDPNRVFLHGKVTGSERVLASNGQRGWMGSMYGGVGSVVSDVLSARSGYVLYTVALSDNREIRVASRERFDAGDCVTISVPASSAQDDYFLQDEAVAEKVKTCSK